MTSYAPSTFVNLAKTGDLIETELTHNEIKQFRKTAEGLLQGAKQEVLIPHARFMLAYESMHMLYIAVVAHYGYLPGKEKGHRSVLLQGVSGYLDLPTDDIDLLLKAHHHRNERSYRVPLPPVSELEALDLIELANRIHAQAKEKVKDIF